MVAAIVCVVFDLINKIFKYLLTENETSLIIFLFFNQLLYTKNFIINAQNFK